LAAPAPVYRTSAPASQPDPPELTMAVKPAPYPERRSVYTPRPAAPKQASPAPRTFRMPPAVKREPVTVASNEVPAPPPSMASQQSQPHVQETLPQPPAPVPMRPEPEAPIAPEPPAPSGHSVTLTRGTLISVRTVEP